MVVLELPLVLCAALTSRMGALPAMQAAGGIWTVALMLLAQGFHRSAYWAGLLHDLGKYQPQWQKWAQEFQRLKTGVIPKKAIAHTDYDPHSDRDKEIEGEANANVGRRPKHSSTGAKIAEEKEI